MQISKIRWLKNDSTADMKHSSNGTSSHSPETEVMVRKINKKPQCPTRYVGMTVTTVAHSHDYQLSFCLGFDVGIIFVTANQGG
jgi:hypothetical protein